jgi:hypothetical protein
VADKTYTEAEHDAILASTVEREVASRDARIAELEATVNDQAGRLDVMESEKAAAEQARDSAVTEFDAFKNGLEELASIDARKTERVDKVREVAKHLGDDFFTAERASRWAAMEETAFSEYLADLGETAAKAGDGKAGGQEIPRESAMEGTRAPAGDSGPSKTSRVLGMRRPPVRRSA